MVDLRGTCLTIRVEASLDRVGDPIQGDELDDGLVRRGDVAPEGEFLADPENEKEANACQCHRSRKIKET